MQATPSFHPSSFPPVHRHHVTQLLTTVAQRTFALWPVGEQPHAWREENNYSLFSWLPAGWAEHAWPWCRIDADFSRRRRRDRSPRGYNTKRKRAQRSHRSRTGPSSVRSCVRVFVAAGVGGWALPREFPESPRPSIGPLDWTHIGHLFL